MKVLIGCLAHQLNSETVQSIFRQEWDDSDGFDVLFAWGGDRQPGETRFACVTRKYQALQRKFLSGPYDALLTVEQDMLLPAHALTRLSRLLRDGADVAYALYVWRYSGQHWWSAHPHLADTDGDLTFWSLTHQPDQARALWGQPVVVEGLGLGCTLISRRTLVDIPFRQRADNHCNDTAFALDCTDAGMIQICDLGTVCGHRMNDRQVVWPDIESPVLYRIEQENPHAIFEI